MKNHMTVLCGDEKRFCSSTHTPTRASNALSLRKAVIGHAGRSDRSPVRLFRTDRRLPLLSNQHFINVIAGVFLGPVYGVAMAFCTSLIRNPHGYRQSAGLPRKHGRSIPGAFLFRKTGRFVLAYAGEIIGTGIIGQCSAIRWQSLMGKKIALFFYVVPFLTSTLYAERPWPWFFSRYCAALPCSHTLTG